jgi:predicted RND superfamily exporter protein
MRIARSGRFVFIAQWVAAVLLPVFFFLGRGLVGAELGWMAIVGIVYGLVVVAILLVPPIMTLFDRTVRREKETRFGYDISSFVLWAALLLAALTVPDSDDSGHLDSAVTTWTGGGISYETSEAVFAVAATLIGLAYLATVVFGIIGIARWRRPVGA